MNSANTSIYCWLDIYVDTYTLVLSIRKSYLQCSITPLYILNQPHCMFTCMCKGPSVSSIDKALSTFSVRKC